MNDMYGMYQYMGNADGSMLDTPYEEVSVGAGSGAGAGGAGAGGVTVGEAGQGVQNNDNNDGGNNNNSNNNNDGNQGGVGYNGYYGGAGAGVGGGGRRTRGGGGGGGNYSRRYGYRNNYTQNHRRGGVGGVNTSDMSQKQQELMKKRIDGPGNGIHANDLIEDINVGDEVWYDGEKCTITGIDWTGELPSAHIRIHSRNETIPNVPLYELKGYQITKRRQDSDVPSDIEFRDDLSVISREEQYAERVGGRYPNMLPFSVVMSQFFDFFFFFFLEFYFEFFFIFVLFWECMYGVLQFECWFELTWEDVMWVESCCFILDLG